MATIGEHVGATIDCFSRSELDFAMLHACVNNYFLTIGHLAFSNFTQLPISDWWGGEDDFRPIARRHNKVRVNFQM